jgi:hypothetical protein
LNKTIAKAAEIVMSWRRRLPPDKTVVSGDSYSKRLPSVSGVPILVKIPISPALIMTRLPA